MLRTGFGDGGRVHTLNTCFANESIDVSDAPCVPDVGPPVPVTWSDPQPSGVVITGYSAAGFDSVGGCPAGGATDIFDGRLPVRETASAFDLRYWAASLVPGTTPLLVQTAGTIVEVGFNTGSHWRIAFVCSTGFADIWRGIKTVGLTPIGTYMRVNGSATTPLCLVVAEQSFDWSTMVWVPTLVQPSGTASAVGVTNTFAVGSRRFSPNQPPLRRRRHSSHPCDELRTDPWNNDLHRACVRCALPHYGDGCRYGWILELQGAREWKHADDCSGHGVRSRRGHRLLFHDPEPGQSRNTAGRRHYRGARHRTDQYRSQCSRL